MSNQQNSGAIYLLIILVLGILLALPNELNIAHIVIDFVAKSLCPNPNISFCESVTIYKILLNVLGVLLIIGDFIFIFEKIKKREFF